MSTAYYPIITVGGVAVAAGLPAPGGLAAIDALKIQWGRATLLEHPTPATATVTVFDAARGYPFARRNDLIGQEVTLDYAIGGGATTRHFRGRVTSAEASPVYAAAGGIDGMAVTLDCSSREVGAANYLVPAGVTFPAESFNARLARIASYLPAGLFSSSAMVLPSSPSLSNVTFGNWLAAASTPGGSDVLTLLRQLYDSCCPAALAYNPNTNYLGPAGQQRVWDHAAGDTSLQVTGRLVAAASRAGRYVAVPGEMDTSHTWLGYNFDAGRIIYPGGLQQDLDTRLTRVEFGYTTSTGAAATATAAVPGAPDESLYGRRTLSVAGVQSEAADAATAAGFWADTAGNAAARRRLDPIVWDTAVSGEFETAGHAQMCLYGMEQNLGIFVAGSWSAALGSRPMLGVIGGTLAYAGGDWRCELTPAPVQVDTTYERPLTIRHASANGARLVDIDPSITFADLAFIDVGPGYTATTQP